MEKYKNILLGFLVGALSIPVIAVALTGANALLDLTGTPMFMALDGNNLFLATEDDDDIIMRLDGTNVLSLDGATEAATFTGDLDLTTTGKTLVLEDGTAASSCIGTGTLTAGDADTVATTCIETGDYVFITRTSADADGAGQEYVDNIVDGTSFDVTSVTDDTATYHWVIIKGQ